MTQKLADMADIRFRYEVANESVSDICSDLRIFTKDLEAVIKEQGWKQELLPGRESTEEDINLYYKQGRMRLSAQMTRRALKTFPRLMRIEDLVIEALEDTIDIYEASVDSSQDLTRLVNAYGKVLDKQTLLQEAINTPALADKNIEELMKHTDLAKVLDTLDGQGRRLPSDD